MLKNKVDGGSKSNVRLKCDVLFLPTNVSSRKRKWLMVGDAVGHGKDSTMQKGRMIRKNVRPDELSHVYHDLMKQVHSVLCL